MAEKQIIRDDVETGNYVAPKDTRKLIARAKELAKRKNAIEKELNQIKSDLKEEMDNLGVVRYVDDHGLVLVTVFDRTNTSFDRKAATDALGAQVIDQFTTQKVSQTLVIK